MIFDGADIVPKPDGPSGIAAGADVSGAPDEGATKPIDLEKEQLYDRTGLIAGSNHRIHGQIGG